MDLTKRLIKSESDQSFFDSSVRQSISSIHNCLAFDFRGQFYSSEHVKAGRLPLMRIYSHCLLGPVVLLAA